MNRIQRLVYMVSVVIMLVACRTLSTEIMPPAINLTDVNSTAVSAASTLFAQTMTAVPTSTVMPTETQLPPTPTRIPLPFMVLEGLRVTYVIDGNLYVQDSGEQEIQLTNSGQDHNPVLSDDGKKIVFSRESKSEMNQLRVIDADGTEEHVLVTNELLTSLDLGYDEFTESHSVAFVPDTHLLLFNTHNFSANYPKADDTRSQQNFDLMLIDTDTGKLKQLAAIGQGGFFLASPNGKWIAVQTPDHVDVIDVQGRIILRNLAGHSPDDYDCVFYGYMCAPMYWTQDSSELILVQPVPLSEIPTNGNGPLIRTVWRYPLDSRPAIETRLNRSPLGETLSVSPDGNWIAYSLFDTGSQDGVYLGNLRDGSSQLIYQSSLNEVTGSRDPAPTSYSDWSPDSMYFIFDDSFRTFVGSVNGQLIDLGRGMKLGLGWIDNRHYFYGGVVSNVDGSEIVRVMEFPPGMDYESYESISFVFVEH